MAGDEKQINALGHVRIQCLGIASNTAEARSGAILKGSDSKFYGVFPSLGFLVCYDFEKGTSSQHIFENNLSGHPLNALHRRQGNSIRVPMPISTSSIRIKEIHRRHSCQRRGMSLIGWGFCEDDNGNIYFAGYPVLYLYSLIL